MTNTEVSRPKVAFWLETESHQACEIARLVGYDILVIDREHGAVPAHALDRIVPFARSIGLTVHVRVAAADRTEIQHALDSGADAVILPQIRDLAHAQEATRFAKYPPLGARGLGYNRTMGYAGANDDYFRAENRRCLCYPMIETCGALRDASAIAELPTVDGLFIGSGDLSLARGRGAFAATDDDLADIRRIADAANAAGKLWAVPALNPKVMDIALAKSAAYVTLGDDLTAMLRGFQALRDLMPTGAG
jgi:2-dehydro-3-deoxyglucarate aldolase/4-hydroxy-2-oxoheptanedioate aldolase